MNLFDINYDLFLQSTDGMSPEKFEDYECLQVNIQIEKNKGGAIIENLGEVDKIRQSLLNIIQNTKDGNYILDTAVPLSRGGNNDTQGKSDEIPDWLKNISSSNKTDASLIIKNILSDLHDYIYLTIITKKQNSDYLYIARNNLVYLVLQLIDYADRNIFKFVPPKEVNGLCGEDEDVYDKNGGNVQVEYDPFNDGITPEDLERRKAIEEKLKANKKTRIHLIKQKIRRVIKQNIKSFQTCLLKRKDSMAYPQSNQLAISGLQLLGDLCSASKENRSLIFTEDGWYHFERIYRRHPLKSILFLQKIFEKDKSILHLDSTVFQRIFNLYSRFFKKIVATEQSIKGVQTNNGVMIYAWNNLLADILKINTKKVALPKVIHMFLMVQEIFNETLFNFVFSHVINVDTLKQNADADPERYLKFKFQMVNQPNEVIQQIFDDNEYFVGTQQGIMLMEIAYSFLRLINKATKHVYNGDMLRMARLCFQKLMTTKRNTDNIVAEKPEVQHHWLFEIEEGLTIRAEIVRFYRNFFVFSLNHLISPNDFQNDLDDKEYDCDVLVSRAHLTLELEEEGNSYVIDGIPKYIINEIKASCKTSLLLKQWWDEEKQDYISESSVQLYVQDYFLKNLFTTIYKYINGIYKLYHFDYFYKNLYTITKSIIVYLNKYTNKAISELCEVFPNVRELRCIKNFLMFLKQKFDELNKISGLFRIENEPFEEEELSRPYYYKLKRYCAIILSSLDNLYANLELEHLLSKYRRVSYPDTLKKKCDEDGFCSSDVEAKFGINLLNYELRQDLVEETTVPDTFLPTNPTQYEIADFFRIRYIESKKKTLLLQNNTIMSFMENSAGHYDCFETFQDFFLKSINNIAPNLFSNNNQMHFFWLDPFYYVLIRIWNNMLTESNEIRFIITKELIANNEVGVISEMTDIQRSMCILYKLHKDLLQIVTYKTFLDRNWKELWDVYFNISDIFKNVCEKNNQVSKKFFNGFSLIYNLEPKAIEEGGPLDMDALDKKIKEEEEKDRLEAEKKARIAAGEDDEDEEVVEQKPIWLEIRMNSLIE